MKISSHLSQSQPFDLRRYTASALETLAYNIKALGYNDGGEVREYTPVEAARMKLKQFSRQYHLYSKMKVQYFVPRKRQPVSFVLYLMRTG